MKYCSPFIVLLCLAAAPATTTSTGPATTRAALEPVPALEMLDGGASLTPPADWTLHGRTDNGMAVRYDSADGAGIIAVIVTPQESTMIRPEAAPQIARVVGQQVREAAKAAGNELLYGPRVEADDRFLLKVRDRQRFPDGTVSDRVQIYRSIHLELIHVAAVAQSDVPEIVASIHEAAEKMLDGARTGAGPKPTSFRRARIRFIVPPDWVEQRTDDPDGVVATYASPDKSGARIVVRAKILPRAAREDAARKQVLLDELVDAERNSPIVPGAGKPREEERYEDGRFARTLRRVVDVEGQEHRSNLRCVEVGDLLIAVAALALPDATNGAFDALSKLADELALSIKPLGEKPVAR